MSRRSFASGVVIAGLIVVVGTAAARAETRDKLTYLTFNAPVQIPGVTLAAGTYRFQLANPNTSRVMQVSSQNGMIVYSQFHTIPDYRPVATDDPTVTFKETRADEPPAIRSFFSGGERAGYEFIYPETIPLALESPQSSGVISPAPYVVTESSSASSVEPAAPGEAAAPPASQPALAPQQETSASEPATPPSDVGTVLPSTSSSLPAVALIGFSMTLVGLGVGALRRYFG